MTPKHIGIVAFDHVVASHLFTTADAFAAAALDDGFGGRIPCYKVWSIGMNSGPLASESGLNFTPQRTLQDSPPLDTIIVAGSSRLRRPDLIGPLSEWILQRVHETRRIASICTGIYGLAPTGLLDGREVTTHWRAARDVAQRFPALRVNHKRRLVKDGPFYTSAGLTAGVDLSLALMEEDYGPQLALSVGRELVTYLTWSSGTKEDAPRKEFASQPVDRFGDLIAWIMRHLHDDLTVEVLARRACMCPTHFTRAFKSVFGTTPGEFVENLRLNEARRRLSTRRKTIHSVAASVGFASAGAFQRAFERRFGMGASSYLASTRGDETSASPKRKLPPLTRAA
jgi:transcriptional regulator GlxA family with amidase domain